MPWDHVSASQFDTFLSCNRKWWLDKIGAHPVRNESASQALGKEVHKVIERYLRGETEGLDHYLLTLNTFVQQVKARQDVELLIEWEFLTPGPKPVLGYIDLVIVDRVARTIEIWDHKTTKHWKYFKSESELRMNPQARVYACELRRVYGDDFRYFFGHHGILTAKVEPEKTVKVEFSIAMLEMARLQLEMTAQQMIGASEVLDGREIVPTLSECWKYGGCSYKARCQGTEPMPSLKEFELTSPTVGPSLPVVIYVDCLPLNEEWVSFSKWTDALEREFKADVGKDALLVKYAEGVIAIATKARDVLQAPEHLFIRTSDAAGMKYLDLVESKVQVVQAVR